jgi:Rrf2 family nitric oxide-sensitive transcriptional repressor
MQKVNRKLEYSLMALKHMSQKMPGELTTAKEVSESYHVPFDATARAMQLMAQKGWLKSEQGAFGGYQLTKDLSKMTLLDLLNMIQGPTKIAKCMNSGEPCESHGSCNIIAPIQNLNTRMNDFYKSLSLREVLYGHDGAMMTP